MYSVRVEMMVTYGFKIDNSFFVAHGLRSVRFLCISMIRILSHVLRFFWGDIIRNVETLIGLTHNLI